MSGEEHTQAPAAQSDVVNVTSENMEQFYAEKLGLPAEGAESAESDQAAALEGELIETEAEPQPEEKKTEPEKPKKKNSFQERIGEVTAEKNAAKEEAQRERAAREALEERIAALEKPAAAAEPEAPPSTKKPDISTYTDVAQYEADLTAYNREMFQAEQRAENSAKAQLQLEQIWEQKKDAFKAEVPDYEAVIEASNLVISDVVKEAIVESDIGPQLAYHLATNPEIAAHLKTLSLASQAREIGKIEAALVKPTNIGEKAAIKVSKAPQPISPIKGATTITDNKVDASGEFTGTPDEYRVLRMAGKIK